MEMMTALLVMPFLVKSSMTGFVPMEWVRAEKCEVFEHEVILTRKYAKTTAEFQFPFSLDGSMIELIEKAKAEQVNVEPNYMCDGPSTYVKAFLEKDGQKHEVVLYSTGGCGSPKTTRNGPYTNALIDIASTFCPTTH